MYENPPEQACGQFGLKNNLSNNTARHTEK